MGRLESLGDQGVGRGLGRSCGRPKTQGGQDSKSKSRRCCERGTSQPTGWPSLPPCL